MELPEWAIHGPAIRDSLPDYEATWTSDPLGFKLALTMPGVGESSSILNVDSGRDLYLRIYKRNNNAAAGAGKLLLRATAYEAARYGATQIRGHFMNPPSLGALASVFGKDNLHFGERFRGTVTPLPDMTFDTAILHPLRYTTTVFLRPGTIEPVPRG